MASRRPRQRHDIETPTARRFTERIARDELDAGGSVGRRQRRLGLPLEIADVRSLRTALAVQATAPATGLPENQGQDLTEQPFELPLGAGLDVKFVDDDEHRSGSTSA